MKIVSCCLLLLPFAGMVGAATIKGQAQKESVLSFLHDALTTTAERTTPAPVTALRNPRCSPAKERVSEDVSDAKSTESSETNRCPELEVFDKNGDESRDDSKDRDSNEIAIPKAVAKNQAPSKETRRVGKAGVAVMDMSSELVQYRGSREASRDQTDRNSEEGVTAKAPEGGSQSSAKPGRVYGMNGMLVHGQSREIPDWDSLEDNDSLAAVGNNKQTDYDETREYVSSETYPVAPPERRPSGSSAPSRSLAA